MSPHKFKEYFNAMYENASEYHQATVKERADSLTVKEEHGAAGSNWNSFGRGYNNPGFSTSERVGSWH